MTPVEPDGDAACWLDRVCDHCGGFIQSGEPHTCRPAARQVGGAAEAPDHS